MGTKITDRGEDRLFNKWLGYFGLPGCMEKNKCGQGETAHWIKVLVARPSLGPEFDSQDSHSGREPVLESCRLTSIYVPWHMSTHLPAAAPNKYM